MSVSNPHPNPHPHQLRLEARTQTHPNAATEREITRAIDEAVFSRVRTYEESIAAAVDEFVAQKETDVVAATELRQAIREEIEYPLLDRHRPTPQLAARYDELRRSAEVAISELERAASEAEWHLERAKDPYAAFSDLMTKWPRIRPSIVLVAK
ncbi:hypothetical protein FLP10_15125 [Agromyces intestinalis]|uniref:Uncharacterized protein n=1 Tax=Agromyces intestinalis TaxID=2592652 RepID=A0A5C1YI15_9MICO|nr:hypothetical protein [Agromyces intestinalis]QEO15611.1 hypothetical protein FLP10_15125 [Agromyces intestinalis]